MRPRPLTPFDQCDIRTLIDDQARARGYHTFAIWEPFVGLGQRWTYSEFRDTIRRFAAGLQARGVKRGERILVHLDNCPESVVAWLGCGYAGAVAVTTNARSTRDEIAYFAAHSDVVGAITQPSFADLVAEAAPDLRWRVVTATDNGSPPATFAATYEPFASLDGDPASLANHPYDPWAHFSVQYTSGTTARPKGVIWTHGNALWGARMCAQNEDLQPDDVHLIYLPLFHTNAQAYSVLATLWAGGTFVITPRFSASRFWQISEKYQATWTSMVPFCAKALMAQPKPAKHSYRLWGNALCDPPWDQDFGVRTIGWWGMTETITHGIVGSVHQPNASMAMGRPSPAYEIHVLDDEGQPVKPGATGNLFVGGTPGISLFLEYAGDPEATANAFREDGLFITGDRVTLGENGLLYFADRSKDMLKVGGENVAASEIESVISTVLGVKEVAVVGKDHPMLDEVPVAFVIPNDFNDPSLEQRIASACTEQLASFKQPQQIRVVESMPRSTIEKVAKAELRAMLAAE